LQIFDISWAPMWSTKWNNKRQAVIFFEAKKYMYIQTYLLSKRLAPPSGKFLTPSKHIKRSNTHACKYTTVNRPKNRGKGPAFAIDSQLAGWVPGIGSPENLSEKCPPRVYLSHSSVWFLSQTYPMHYLPPNRILAETAK